MRTLRVMTGGCRGFIKELSITPPSLFRHMKPTAICVGVQKTGTTALYRYLGRHPDVAPAKTKEIDFFNCDSRYSLGHDFYHSHFPRKTLWNFHKVTFDITPGYFGYAQKAAERIFKYNPQIKLIALLRDPIPRAHSAWQMYRRNYKKNPDWFFDWVRRCDETVPKDFYWPRPTSFGEEFARDILDEIEAMERGRSIEMPILRLGVYHTFLQYYFKHFKRDQMLIICTERMGRDTVAELRRVERFVGLRQHSWTQTETQKVFVGGYSEKIPYDAEDLLKKFYSNHNDALFSLLDEKFPWG